MKKILITGFLLLLIILTTFIWWKNGLSSVNLKDNTPHIFIVEPGQGIREISKNLKDQGLIKDQVVFFLLTKKLGLDKKIEAGDYRLYKSMSADEIANDLTHGTLDIWVTITEGLRADEIADLLEKQIPSYEKTWRKQLEDNEGYLFPDTYLIPKDASINLVLTLLKDNFTKKFDSIKNIKTTNLTDAQTVIIASIIEREAIFTQDQPIVASVIINRLNLGMPLQVDPSVQYALGYQADTKTWWKKELTLDDLKFNSGYNTYLNPGLPEGPISNPGISSLKAALTPATTNFLYYYSDKSGHLHFGKTLQEHQANIKKYGSS